MAKPAPQLPHGTSSAIGGITENFAFHRSPESFILSRIDALKTTDPDLFETRAPVRAKVLNRNVAVISSYRQIKQVLQCLQDESDCKREGEPGFVAGEAYDELMAPFFPSPNLLLADGVAHAGMRGAWEGRMAGLTQSLAGIVKATSQEHFRAIVGSGNIDIYQSMKTLSWKLLLGTLLNLAPKDREYTELEHLQEDLLRGQFSLFPVSVNAGFWHSPRKRGIDARRKLQEKILQRLRADGNSCPFTGSADGQMQEIADHVLLFTSSLAAKGLASLLTAVFLNLYLYQGRIFTDGKCEAWIRSDPQASTKRLESLIKETERLSPPIVGIMRRCTRDNVLQSPDGRPDILLPQGWDTWLYFVGAGRDPARFGKTWERFDPARYLTEECPGSMAFGAGPKACLGRDFTRRLTLAVAEACLDMRMSISGKVDAKGVRAWLGWETGDEVSLADWSRDMKQLPTQHPSRPVLVSVTA